MAFARPVHLPAAEPGVTRPSNLHVTVNFENFRDPVALGDRTD